jgi:outer membrane protein
MHAFFRLLNVIFAQIFNFLFKTMKTITVKVVLFAMFGLMANSASAQKYGHLNYGNLLSSLKETRAADSTLVATRNQLLAKAEVMAKAFETKYVAFNKDVQSGTLSRVQQQERETGLRKEQEDLQKFDQQMQADLGKKRDELLKPIIDKVQAAIQGLGKEGGYQFIFDTSSGSMLFALPGDDVEPLIKKKLGITK